MHLILQCAVQLPNEMKRRRSKRNILKGIGRDYQCLRNRSALAVNCCVIIHCLEVSCKEDQITSAQRE